MWPFRKLEKRNFTVSATDRAMNSALGIASEAGVVGTAAATVAVGTYGRAFAAAEVAPSTERTGLRPAVMAQIGAAFISHGESVWLISIAGGGVRLHRAASWLITGIGPDPDNWRYDLTMPGPSGIERMIVPAEAVLHPRANMAPSAPHRGRSPLALAGYSAAALANAERQLAEELSGPVGRLIPAPLESLGPVREDGIDPLSDLEASLGALSGGTALVPTLARVEFTGGAGTASDWRSVRIGADPPESVVTLRGDGHNAILAACGVPPQLFSGGAQANSAREALRQFLHLAISPVARVLEDEARTKLETDVSVSFTNLHASDVQGRARSFKALVDGGMSLPDAAAASGILIGEND